MDDCPHTCIPCSFAKAGEAFGRMIGSFSRSLKAERAGITMERAPTLGPGTDIGMGYAGAAKVQRASADLSGQPGHQSAEERAVRVWLAEQFWASAARG